MQFTTDQQTLSTALHIVSRAVSQKSNTLPILANIMFDAREDGWLVLTATNLEISITERFKCAITLPGTVTIPAKLLTDFVSSMDKLEQITFTLNSENYTVKVQGGKFQATINCITADDYPNVSVSDKGSEELTSIPVGTFKNSLSQVVYAASSDETRPVLTGMFIKFVEGSNQLELACADSFRLARKVVELPNVLEGTNTLIVPSRALKELISVLGAYQGNDWNVSVCVKYNHESKVATQVIFRIDDLIFTASLIEGNFPNYDQIIPKSKETSIVLDTKETLGAVKVASLFAKDNGNNIVQLHLKGDTATFTANAAQVGDNTTTLPAQIEGAEMSIALNAAFLRDALQAVGTQQVRLELQTASNPVVVKPVSADGKEDYIVVVMPMHLATR